MTSLAGRHVATGSCVILRQASQEQNFEDEGGKRVVIGTGLTGGGVIGAGWEMPLETRGERLDRRSKLNRQADYCFKN